MSGIIGMIGERTQVGVVVYPSLKAAYRDASARAEKAGKNPVNYITFYKRIKNGWSAADAFHKPVRDYNEKAA
jgi:hypothetical protein